MKIDLTREYRIKYILKNSTAFTRNQLENSTNWTLAHVQLEIKEYWEIMNKHRSRKVTNV